MPEYYTIHSTILKIPDSVGFCYHHELNRNVFLYSLFATMDEAKDAMPHAFYEIAKLTDDSYRQFQDREDGLTICKVPVEEDLKPRKYYLELKKDNTIALHLRAAKGRFMVEYKASLRAWEDLYSSVKPTYDAIETGTLDSASSEEQPFVDAYHVSSLYMRLYRHKN